MRHRISQNLETLIDTTSGPCLLEQLDRVASAKVLLAATIDVCSRYGCSCVHGEFEARSRFACEGVDGELRDSSIQRDSSAHPQERIQENRLSNDIDFLCAR